MPECVSQRGCETYVKESNTDATIDTKRNETVRNGTSKKDKKKRAAHSWTHRDDGEYVRARVRLHL